MSLPQQLQDLESLLPTLRQEVAKCCSARRNYREALIAALDDAQKAPLESVRARLNDAIALMASCDECLISREAALHIGYESWGVVGGKYHCAEAEVTECLLRASTAHSAFCKLGITLPRLWRQVWEHAKRASTGAELMPLLNPVNAAEKELFQAIEMGEQVYDLWRKTTSHQSKSEP